jgi:uncharacterized membrane protein YraQ (UPF0718 family)
MLKTLKTVESGVLKTAGFLLVLGLAIGLWIGLWMGFNLRTRTQVTRDSNLTKAFFVKIGTGITTSAHKFESQFKAGSKTASSPKTTSQPNTAIGRQISDALKGLWQFLQSVWLRVTAGLHTSST